MLGEHTEEVDRARSRDGGVVTLRSASNAGPVLDDVAPVGDLDAAARSQRFICNLAPPKNPSTLSKSMISGTPLRSLSRLRSPSGACS